MQHNACQINFKRLTVWMMFFAGAHSWSMPLMSGGLGSGYAYTARHTAIYTNPAGLVSGDSPYSLYGVYGFDSKDITGTLSTTAGMVGLGGGFVYDNGGTNIITGGAAFALSKLAIGFSMNKVGSGDPSFNGGMTLDLSALRVAAVVRNLNNISSVAAAAGIVSGPLRLEADIDHAWPLSSKTSTIVAGLVYNGRPMSISLNYRKLYENGRWSEGTFGAGIEFDLDNELALQGEYNPTIDSSKYIAGVRMKF